MARASYLRQMLVASGKAAACVVWTFSVILFRAVAAYGEGFASLRLTPKVAGFTSVMSCTGAQKVVIKIRCTETIYEVFVFPTDGKQTAWLMLCVWASMSGHLLDLSSYVFNVIQSLCIRCVGGAR